MSTLFASSTNLSQHRVAYDSVPWGDDFFGWLSQSLRRFGFKDISESNDEQSVGWVQMEDTSAVGFESPAYVWIDHYVFLRVRKDTRKVPGAVLQQEIKARSDEWLTAHPELKRPPKRVREEIKDAAKLSLLAKTLPVPKLLDAVWDINSAQLLILSASQSEIDLFDDLFRKTFDGFRIVEEVPFGLAGKAVAGDAHLSKYLAGCNQAGSDSLLDLIVSNKWLGREFVLWIMAVKSQNGGAYVDNKLVLAGDDQKAAYSGSIDANLAAIRQALAEGKTISDATVYVSGQNDEQWRVGLNTETFRLKSIKHPVLSIADAGSDKDDAMQADMLMRVWSLNTVCDVLLRELLREFLDSRCSGAFDGERIAWLEA